MHLSYARGKVCRPYIITSFLRSLTRKLIHKNTETINHVLEANVYLSQDRLIISTATGYIRGKKKNFCWTYHITYWAHNVSCPVLSDAVWYQKIRRTWNQLQNKVQTPELMAILNLCKLKKITLRHMKLYGNESILAN